ncbi:hypothetical protein F5B21DRAFT_356831 [Xylaria acuta]|nr:hypothetical protein F5B21DRAFT_356831 [Xylaria acuta]
MKDHGHSQAACCHHRRRGPVPGPVLPTSTVYCSCSCSTYVLTYLLTYLLTYYKYVLCSSIRILSFEVLRSRSRPFAQVVPSGPFHERIAQHACTCTNRRSLFPAHSGTPTPFKPPMSFSRARPGLDPWAIVRPFTSVSSLLPTHTTPNTVLTHTLHPARASSRRLCSSAVPLYVRYCCICCSLLLHPRHTSGSTERGRRRTPHGTVS